MDRFDPSADAIGLHIALDNIAFDKGTIDKATFIWNRIAHLFSYLISGTIEFSTTQSFTHPRRTQEVSILGKELMEYAWLPDRRGNFHRPGEITTDDLPDGFIRDETLARQLGMKSSVESKLAEEAGISLAVIKAVQRHGDLAMEVLRQAGLLPLSGGNDPTFDGNRNEPAVDFRAELERTFSRDDSERSEESYALEPGPVPNPAARRERLEKEIRADIDKEPTREERVRLVKHVVWEDKDVAVRTFLREQYGGTCQICATKPFLKRDGEPYFTGVYLVPHTKARWIDRPGNALCLCATCCAKFLHGSVEAPDIVQQIQCYRAHREGGMDHAELTIKLCGAPARIRISERHMLELQSMLESASMPEGVAQ